MTTIGILGASGFVGSTLTETLLATGGCEVRPFIHHSGNAWRLARLGIELPTVDLLSPETLEDALSGCTHIVNCSRGPKEVMLKGLSNLLAACRRAKIQRFVHLSSSAVYEGPYPDTPIDETFANHAKTPSYGGTKIAQDKLVVNAHRDGLSAVVLCPPNISGPYSPYLINLIDTMQAGKFALVDSGNYPCMLVDVRNLVHAIILSLSADGADGNRIFITDEDEVSWRQLADGMAEITGINRKFPSITLEEAQRYTATNSKQRISIKKFAKHMVSSEVRSVLRRDPTIASMEKFSKSICSAMPNSFQRTLRSIVNSAPASGAGAAMRHTPKFDAGLIGQQLRRVRYSGRRAAEKLDYTAAINFSESIESFGRWYAQFFGLNNGYEDLFSKLRDKSHLNSV